MDSMLKYGMVITITLTLLSGMCFSVSANPDAGDKKIYHNEKWDILILYPDDWSYIEEFGDNVPVIMHPPKDEEPDGFVMVYFAGEGVVKDLDELGEYYEKEVLATYESYEILSVEEGKTKEGFPTLDYNYTFEDHGDEFISNTRLIIADDDNSWAIIFDHPPGCPESIEKEGLKLIESVIFSAAEYLTNEE